MSINRIASTISHWRRLVRSEHRKDICAGNKCSGQHHCTAVVIVHATNAAHRFTQIFPRKELQLRKPKNLRSDKIKALTGGCGRDRAEASM